MAIRNVNTDFWSDPKITDEFTYYDKYFWLFLLTTRYGNLAGCFELSIKQMQIDLGLPTEKVKEQINRFIDYGLIDYDENTNEILLINYHKHNWSKSPKFISAIEKQVHKIKNQVFKDYIFNILNNNENEIGYRYGMDRVSIPYKVKVKVKDKVKDKVLKTKDLSIKDNNISNDKVDTSNNDNKVTNTTTNSIKKPYGELGNVLLTDKEYGKLNRFFAEHFLKYIRDLDLYIESTGKKYRSHYAAIRQWLNRDNIQEQEMIIEDVSDEEVEDLIKMIEEKKKAKK